MSIVDVPAFTVACNSRAPRTGRVSIPARARSSGSGVVRKLARCDELTDHVLYGLAAQTQEPRRGGAVAFAQRQSLQEHCATDRALGLVQLHFADTGRSNRFKRRAGAPKPGEHAFEVVHFDRLRYEGVNAGDSKLECFARI